LVSRIPESLLDRETGSEDRAVIAALRVGDESTFVAFAARHQGSLMRLARHWVKNEALAEEVVQETWLTMLESADKYEGRSPLKTWLCGILVNVARNRIRKEGHSVPMSSLGDPDEPAVDPGRFSPPGVPWEGHWWPPPNPFPESPEAHVLNRELRADLEDAIGNLPPAQREVIVLQDVEGFRCEEVSEILGLTATHERVLLHRARAKIRATLERHYEGRAS
jgi:RNA polymerase sigma-70 factor (ECF subfamily)